MSNLHDSFFQFAFSIPTVYRKFIELCLPPEFVALLDLDTLKEDPTHYISRGRRRFFSDKVFSCQLKTETLLSVTILKEHKSYVDEHVVFQMLEYLSGILRKKVVAKAPLTPVFAVLLTHTDEDWKVKNILDFFPGLPDWLKPYQPQFAFWIVNLSKFSDDFILNLPADYLKNLLYVFKHHHDKAFLLEHVDDVFADIHNYLRTPEGKNFAQELFSYFTELLEIAPNDLESVIETKFSKKVKPLVMGAITQIRQEERQIGMQLGLEKGLEKGMEKGAEFFLKAIQLIKKFPKKTDKQIAKMLGVNASFIVAVRLQMELSEQN